MENKVKHMNVELTKRCNLRCSYCFNDSGKPMKYELSLGEWKDILNTGKEYGGETLLITGGEFMMRNDSIEILNFALDKGLKTSILSNGYKINSIEENILKKLQKAQISVDSYDALLHNSRRGKGSWETALNAINYLRENNVPVEISATISPTDIPEIAGLAKLAFSTDSNLLLRPIQNIGRSKEKLSLTNNELKNTLREVEKEYGKIFVEDFERYVPVSEEDDKDNLKKGIITILPNGNIRGVELDFYDFCKREVA